jgi:hypothetical protein
MFCGIKQSSMEPNVDYKSMNSVGTQEVVADTSANVTAGIAAAALPEVAMSMVISEMAAAIAENVSVAQFCGRMLMPLVASLASAFVSHVCCQPIRPLSKREALIPELVMPSDEPDARSECDGVAESSDPMVPVIAYRECNLPNSRLCERRVSVSGLPRISGKLTNRAVCKKKFSEIDILDVYSKYGKYIFQLKCDTLRFLRNDLDNAAIRHLISSRFAPFFMESTESVEELDKQYLYEDVCWIVSLITLPECFEWVCRSWMSLMDVVGFRTFYGILQYMFADN